MDSPSRHFEISRAKEKTILSQTFFQQEEVTQIAQKILGKFLFTSFNKIITGGIITETEAYKGREDKACHAYQGRPTKRIAFTFGPEEWPMFIFAMLFITSLISSITTKEHLMLS